MKKMRAIRNDGTRLVNRNQLQNAANQIAGHLVNGMKRLEEQQDARMNAIQQRVDELCDQAGLLRVNWPPVEAKPQLVTDASIIGPDANGEGEFRAPSPDMPVSA